MNIKTTLPVLFLIVSTTTHAYYQAEQGRWLSRDPIGEYGGVHLSSFVYNRGLNCFDPVGLCSQDDVQSIADNVKERMCCALRATVETDPDLERGGGSYKGRPGKDARQYPKIGAQREKYDTGRNRIIINAPPEQGLWTTNLDEQPLELIWHTHPNNWTESKPSDEDIANAQKRAKSDVNSLVLTKDNVYCWDKTKEEFVDLGSPDNVLDCKDVCCDDYKDTDTPGLTGGFMSGLQGYPGL